MSIRSMRTLATRRRTPEPPGGGAPAAAVQPDPDGWMSLEQAIPTEIITFYTAVIAACQTVLVRSPTATFTPFRLAVYAVGLLATGGTAFRALGPVMGDGEHVMKAPEWWTAVVAFAGWGAAVPGSFLYVWLSPDALTITVATITAVAGLVLSLVLSPQLKAKNVAASTAPETGVGVLPAPGSGRAS